MPKKPTHYPMVHIIWGDAVSTGGEWLTHKQFMKSCKVSHAHTCGFLIEETEESYIVAQSYFPHDKVKSQGTAIPKAWVEEYKLIDYVPPLERLEEGDADGQNAKATETTS